MKKLLIGLLALGSSSSFAYSDVNDIKNGIYKVEGAVSECSTYISYDKENALLSIRKGYNPFGGDSYFSCLNDRSNTFSDEIKKVISSGSEWYTDQISQSHMYRGYYKLRVKPGRDANFSNCRMTDSKTLECLSKGIETNAIYDSQVVGTSTYFIGKITTKALIDLESKQITIVNNLNGVTEQTYFNDSTRRNRKKIDKTFKFNLLYKSDWFSPTEVKKTATSSDKYLNLEENCSRASKIVKEKVSKSCNYVFKKCTDTREESAPTLENDYSCKALLSSEGEGRPANFLKLFK